MGCFKESIELWRQNRSAIDGMTVEVGWIHTQ